MSSDIKIGALDLADTIQNSLNSYHIDVTEKIKKLTQETAKELAKTTKKDSPVRTGEYKKHISYKKTYESNLCCKYVWYVKDPEYRLTHLISNGHATRNGGKSKSNDFLRKNVVVAEKNYVKGIKEICDGR